MNKQILEATETFTLPKPIPIPRRYRNQILDKGATKSKGCNGTIPRYDGVPQAFSSLNSLQPHDKILDPRLLDAANSNRWHIETWWI